MKARAAVLLVVVSPLLGGCPAFIEIMKDAGGPALSYFASVNNIGVQYFKMKETEKAKADSKPAEKSPGEP